MTMTYGGECNISSKIYILQGVQKLPIKIPLHCKSFKTCSQYEHLQHILFHLRSGCSNILKAERDLQIYHYEYLCQRLTKDFYSVQCGKKLFSACEVAKVHIYWFSLLFNALYA